MPKISVQLVLALLLVIPSIGWAGSLHKKILCD